MTETRNILVFGTFDGLHQGHKFFLRSAKSRGSHLSVGVAHDEHIVILKGKKPQGPLFRRMEEISKLSYVDETLECDKDLGSFKIIEKALPDLIILGHDQLELEQELLKWMSEHDHYVPMLKIKKI
jgi:cytidyltransferase-like protein